MDLSTSGELPLALCHDSRSLDASGARVDTVGADKGDSERRDDFDPRSTS